MRNLIVVLILIASVLPSLAQEPVVEFLQRKGLSGLVN